MNRLKRIYCRVYQTIMHIAIPFLPYRTPKILSTQDEIPTVLASKHIQKVFIVTDKGIIQNGLIEELKRILTTSEILFYIYDDTVVNPTIDNVEEARRMYLSEDCQGIIAVGGGSAMDLAKAVGARIVRPHKSVKKMKGLLHVRKKLPPFIAIPTTAGTGSETTLAAVITDSQTHHKYPINDFSLIPHYAVLDYRMTLTLPKHITATTGMDALTHAVEAYIGKSRTPQTKKMAVRAVCLIKENLKKCYDNPQNAEARKNMLYAAHYAGIAFTKSYVGYIHAVAHSLGGRYRIPHGLANAVILPIFLEEYGHKIDRKLAVLAKTAGLASSDEKDSTAARKFILWVYEMNASMGIPKRLSGIHAEDIPQMARYADKEGNPLYPVPVLMDTKELAKMYGKVME